jgi:uncharacterized membrane protein
MGPFGPPPPENVLPHLDDELAGKLAAADAALVRRIFDTHAAEIAERFRAVGRAHEQVRAALNQEPFDPAALAAALDQVRGTELALHGVVQQTIAEIAPGLSPASRHTLATWGPGPP